jgi:hypothetical protein
VEETRVPFRRLYRIVGDGHGVMLDVGRFETARRRLLEVVAMVAALPVSPVPTDLFWGDLPLAVDGLVRWAIVAAEGEAPWKDALALQEAIQTMAGRRVPVSRSFPVLDAEIGPLLVWVMSNDGDAEFLPSPVKAALARRPTARAVSIGLKGGVTVVVLRPERDLEALLKTFRSRAEFYTAARDAR